MELCCEFVISHFFPFFVTRQIFDKIVRFLGLYLNKGCTCAGSHWGHSACISSLLECVALEVALES